MNTNKNHKPSRLRSRPGLQSAEHGETLCCEVRLGPPEGPTGNLYIHTFTSLAPRGFTHLHNGLLEYRKWQKYYKLQRSWGKETISLYPLRFHNILFWYKVKIQTSILHFASKEGGGQQQVLSLKAALSSSLEAGGGQQTVKYLRLLNINNPILSGIVDRCAVTNSHLNLTLPLSPFR